MELVVKKSEPSRNRKVQKRLLLFSPPLKQSNSDCPRRQVSGIILLGYILDIKRFNFMRYARNCLTYC